MCRSLLSTSVFRRIIPLLMTGMWVLFPPHAIAEPTFSVTETSNPPGLIPAKNTNVADGAVHRVQNFSVVSGSHRFGFWTFNGVRQSFPNGQAYIYPEATVTGNIDAVAHFFPADQDGDGDRLADWWEYWMFGDRSRGPQDDDDGDGITHEDEFRYGYSARFRDELPGGGISTRLSAPVRLIIRNRLTWSLRSHPLGLVSADGELTPGQSYTTPHLTGDVSGFTFVGFEVDGEPVRDVTGYYLNQITVTPTADTQIIARYVPAGVDSDGDGIIDSLEYQHFGGLHYDRDDDPDGDGLTIGEELAMGLSLIAADSVASGGVSARLSAPLAYDRVRTKYIMESRPLGLFTRVEEMVTTGTARTSLHFGTGAVSGFVFGYWSVNGERIASPDGLARRQVSVTVDEPTTVVAHFFDPAADTDGDGLPDWWEWNMFGTLEHDKDSDPDGDGMSIAEEQRLGLPVAHVDFPVSGGLSTRMSAPLNYETGTRKRLAIRSRPLGIVTTSDQYMTAGTPIASAHYNFTGLYSGHYFTHWTRNGERVADTAGHSRSQFGFDLTEDTELVAHFVLPGEDLDDDGIPDYLELRLAEDLAAIGPGVDFDGDGFTYEEEKARGYSHVLKDELRDGGVSTRLSAPATLQFLTPPLDLLPARLATVRGAPAGSRVGVLSVSPSSGRTYQFALVLGEGDRDNNRFSISAGELRLASTVDTAAPATLLARIRATDDLGVARFWQVAVQVHESLLLPLGARSVEQGRELTVRPQVSVPEMGTEADAISMVSGPSGSGYDPSTGLWSWTPGFDDAPGVYTIILQATNGLLTDERSLTVSVIPGTPPTPEDPDFEEWAALNFTPAQLADPTYSGPLAMPFDDGVPNLFKFAFNLSATGPDSRVLEPGTGTAGLPLIRLVSPEPGEIGAMGSDRKLQAEFLRRKNGGLIYRPEFSSNLAGEGIGAWRVPSSPEIVTPIDDRWERVVVEDDVANEETRFGRVRVLVEAEGE